MNTEKMELLNRLDELIMEAENKGYCFEFSVVDEATKLENCLYSDMDTFGIDIIEM